MFAALDTGQIMRAKARVFAELPAADIDRICRALLPRAPGLTTGQLRARLARLVIATDPSRAGDQYEKAATRRSVIGYLNPDGTAAITADGLPPGQAASACERIDQLARAVKRAGHHSHLDQIGAQVFLGLLDGRYHRPTRTQIIIALLAQDTHDPTEPDPAGPATGIEVRAELSTLLGRDEHPGEIPGWGPILADLARGAVARQRRAQWRYAITDPHGHLLHEGITRRRPTSTRDAATGGIVELHIPATLLTELADHSEGRPFRRRGGRHRRPVRQPPTRPRRPCTPAAAVSERPTTPPRPNPRAHLPRTRLPTPRHQLTNRQHTRLPPRRPHHPIQHGPTLQPRPRPQTTGRWRLHQPQPGTFHWHSPLGGIYHIRGDPIISPLCEPEDDGPPCGEDVEDSM